MKLIYDFGANTGSNIPYYLLKADRVIAVEANPSLCSQIRHRFSCEIEAERLIVVNCAVVPTSGPTEFFVHRTNSVLSQVGRPHDALGYDAITVPGIPASEIIQEHGAPFYIKIDVEGQDKNILRDLLGNDIMPPYISAEAHCVDVFALLITMGYQAFKLVDGASVCDRYKNYPVEGIDGAQHLISFPYHSAGPFGCDVAGNWMTANNFARQIVLEEFGWKDIHASRADTPDPSALYGLRKVLLKKLRNPRMFLR